MGRWPGLARRGSEGHTRIVLGLSSDKLCPVAYNTNRLIFPLGSVLSWVSTEKFTAPSAGIAACETTGSGVRHHRGRLRPHGKAYEQPLDVSNLVVEARKRRWQSRAKAAEWVRSG